MGEVTGRGEVVRIALADETADAVVAALAKLPFVQSPLFEPASRTVEVRVKGAPAEEAIPAMLRATLDAGGRVVGVTRGQRREERLLALT